MRTIVAVLFFGLFSFTTVFAQNARNTKSLTQYWGKRHKNTVYGTNKRLSRVCPGMELSEYPFQGIGLKLGDPFAITYRLYIDKTFSVGIDEGIAAYGLYKRRYTDLFHQQPGSDTLTYVSHNVQKDIHLSIKGVYYLPKFGFMEDVNTYLTFGWQFRFVEAVFGYTYQVSQSETRFGQSNLSLDHSGPEVNLGIEYPYKQLPLAAFAEIGTFIDIVQPPSHVQVQFGVGLRYFF